MPLLMPVGRLTAVRDSSHEPFDPGHQSSGLRRRWWWRWMGRSVVSLSLPGVGFVVSVLNPVGKAAVQIVHRSEPVRVSREGLAGLGSSSRV
jgi:hypothetical protein